ncbi:MAG: hypothetical protein K2G67_03425 [Muribaculaceae bacterium]|nr:hypothetical protein [Muribaculaceae bacterium]
MHSIHILNIDSDYALASGRRYYTPPAHISMLKRSLQLLPALYAAPGDIIVVNDLKDVSDEALSNMIEVSGAPAPDNISLNSLVNRNISFIGLDDLGNNDRFWKSHIPDPWGWNLSIRQFFLDVSGGNAIIPSEERIEKLRDLSHRRTSIRILSYLPIQFRENIVLPEEITDAGIAVKAFQSGGPLYFKAPWSSSGRGVMETTGLEQMHVEPWIRGIIRRQGSVMMEKAYERALDFATEWMCSNGSASYLGVSVFKTSRRGKYHGNMKDTQEELTALIDSHINVSLKEVINAQKEALETIVCPDYDGPAGIDMLATPGGDINPCVEINLRHTMGMIGLL